MTTPRFTGAANQDNTDRKGLNDFQAPAFAATIALVINPSAKRTLIQPATLTGVVTFSVNVGDAVTPPYVGDKVDFQLVSDGTTRVVTFGTGFAPNGTLSVTTAKYGSISFVFNGTAWIETCRTVTA